MRLNSTKYYAFLLCCLAAPFSILAKDAKITGAQQQLLQHNDLHFIENKGQITDQHHKVRNDIQYKIAAGGMNVFIGNGELHYQFDKNEGEKVNSYRMDVVLKGANKHARVIADEKQDYFEHYGQAQYGAAGVTAYSYNKVTYKDVYPGIDWVLYIKNNTLEYDFIVHPGGDANDIQLACNGAQKMSVDADGSIKATTPLGVITEKAPFTYAVENGQNIKSKFVLHNNTLSFDVAPHSGTIVIDPEIAWGTYFGGTGTESGTCVTVDGSGNIYLSGSTNSLGNIATSFGTYQTSFGGGFSDAFLIKFNSAGVRQWATYFGGPGQDIAYGVACDASDNVYITGKTNSNTGISAGNAYQVSLGVNGSNSTLDAFLAKFDNAGTLLWATYVGGNGTDVGNAVACDPLGNVYIAGYTLSSANLATPGAYQTTLGGGSTYGDVLLAKFDAAGNNYWVTYYGGNTSDDATGIVCDAASNIYITGITGSAAVIATAGTHQSTYAGPANQIGDAFISKFNTTGTLVWGSYFGGANTEVAGGIAIDGNNNLYIDGNTNSTSAISTAGAYQVSLNGTSNDAYLAKFDTSGNLLWSTYAGGTSGDLGYGISTDAQNNVYIVGNTISTNGISTSNAYQVNNVGGSSGYLMEFNNLGQLLYGTFFGGTGTGGTLSYGVANYKGANPFTVMAGTTGATINIATAGAYQTQLNGTNSGTVTDAFLTKFYIDTNVNIKQPYTDTSFCAGGTFIVHDTTNFPFNAGNTFTVQLSDATGSFAAPVVIGSVTATSSGPISCTIPGGTPAGTGYRIRIVATNPAYTSADDDVNITIISGSITAPTVAYNAPVCVGDSLKFTVTPTSSISPLTYSWSGPVSFSSSIQNASRANITTAMAGVYTVTTSHAGCPSVDATINVTINNTIPAMPTAGSNSPLCAGQTLTLNSSSTTAGVSYSWTGPNGYTSTAQNPVYTSVPASAAGYYYVTAVLNGCRSQRDSVNAIINSTASPVVTITALNGDTVCFGSEANFMATITNGGTNPQYQWYVNNISQIGAISDIWGSPYLTGNTQVYCIATSNGACVTNPVDTSNIITVDILSVEVPSVTITASPGNSVTIGTGVTFSTSVINGGANTTYQWQINGVNVPGETYSTFTTHLLNDQDVVTVVVTSDAPCAQPASVVSNAITMHVGVGVTQVSAFSEVTLYPNPNNGTFSVKGALNDINGNDVSLEILNAVGQVVYQHNITLQGSALNEPVSLNNNIPDGVYMLRLSAGNESKVFRFTLQR